MIQLDDNFYKDGFVYERKQVCGRGGFYYNPVESEVLNMDLEIYLTSTKDLNVKNLTMSQMLYWSKHNVYAYINVLYTLAMKK